MLCSVMLLANDWLSESLMMLDQSRACSSTSACKYSNELQWLVHQQMISHDLFAGCAKRGMEGRKEVGSINLNSLSQRTGSE